MESVIRVVHLRGSEGAFQASRFCYSEMIGDPGLESIEISENQKCGQLVCTLGRNFWFSEIMRSGDRLFDGAPACAMEHRREWGNR